VLTPRTIPSLFVPSYKEGRAFVYPPKTASIYPVSENVLKQIVYKVNPRKLIGKDANKGRSLLERPLFIELCGSC
jgi:hypothetical protein